MVKHVHIWRVRFPDQVQKFVSRHSDIRPFLDDLFDSDPIEEGGQASVEEVTYEGLAMEEGGAIFLDSVKKQEE